MPNRISRRGTILSVTLAGAVAAQIGATVALPGADYLCVQAILTVAGGGTTVNAWVQTSLDGGTTWIDVMNFSFTNSTATKVSAVTANIALAAGVTPVDGSLASNTILNGLLGTMFRVKYTTTGTFTGATTLVLNANISA